MTSKKLILGLLLAITITFLMTSENAFADTTGPQNTTLAVNNTSPSISEFLNENNAFTSDNNRASGFINFDQAYGAFGFDVIIPDDAIINGITVNLEGRKTLLCGAIIGSPTFNVRLSNPSLIGVPNSLGSFTGNTYTTGNFGTTDSIISLGNSTDTWGNTYPNVDNLWILVRANCGLLLTAMQLDQVTVDVDYTIPVRKNGDSCSNCQNPSIGITSDGRRVVEGGITVNGQMSNANFYFTPFPLVQADINEQITMLFVIWDDKSDNIAHVELGLGKGKTGESFQKESSMIWNRHVMTKIETVTYDEEFFKDVSMSMEGKAPCTSQSTDQKCDLFKVQFTPIKAIVGDVVFGISIWDDRRNAMTTFFNEGLQIGTEADVIPEVEFVAPEGTGNKSYDTGSDPTDQRWTEGFKSHYIEYTKQMEQIAKERFGY